MTQAVRSPRQYESPLRRQQAAETRERIILAGCELLKRSSVRDWQGLTIRAVADQAGVNERTVYRNFANERGLRDAVMHRLEALAGIDLAGMRLTDVPDVAARTLRHIATYPRNPHAPLDATLSDASRRQHEALGHALAAAQPDWTDAQRTGAAAILDLLWSVASFERLAIGWQLSDEAAIGAVTWVIGLISDAVEGDCPPCG